MSIGSRVNPQPRRRDWVVAFAGVLILTDVFDTSLRAAFGADAIALPGLPVARVPLLLVFVAAALLLVDHRNRALSVAAAAWPLWPALALACVSTVWSVAPGTTLSWAPSLLGVSIFGLALAVRFSPLQQAEIVTAVVASSALAAMLVSWQSPAFTASTGAGLYEHKNLLGRVMALGIGAAMTMVYGGRHRAPGIVAALLCTGLLLAANSRAALLSAGIAGAVMALLLAARAWRRQRARILLGGVLVVGVGLLFLLATEPGLELLRRNERFSERTRIWTEVIKEAGTKPWLGHGYGAFWQSEAGRLIPQRLKIPFGWHAHSGFVELYADLGAVGLALVLVPMAWCATRALRHALGAGARACVWPVVYLVFFVASNAAETSLLRHKIYWALYVAIACHVAIVDTRQREVA